ncbi:MAG: sensor histidine kinase [Alphaproteobacteria bacterium]|nr:sensor histidine kinase [Alphaproteobacteria bacterium]
MRVNSLSFRLLASSALIAIVLLAVAAFLLNALFQQALERNFDQRLKAALDGILANVELKPDGTPRLQGPIADIRFSLPLSGWYWQVSLPDAPTTLLASGSLLEQHIAVPKEALSKRDSEGTASFSAVDSEGKQLRAIEQRFKLFGSTQNLSFLVAGNFDELKSEVSSFRRTLLAVLGLLGAGLLIALMAQVRFGLRPLAEMQHALNDIRGGKIEMLHDDFPEEIQPVADELNLLVQANFEVIERARMQVGNLAHALKTPISVLTNEARDTKGPLADKVKEQIDVMRDQVNLYLDRARRAARAQTIGSAADVEPVLQSLARTLTRINRDRNLAITVEAPANLRFRGERQDLEEMVGNVMDNACKWAKGRIVVKAVQVPPGSEDGRSWLLLSVSDDGPGIPAEQRGEALKRGQRLDESKPGSGLGMSIIAETAAMYGGTIELSESEWKGLKFNLKLPSIS